MQYTWQLDRISTISQAIVESDAKICINAINGPSIASLWRIQVLCSDTTKLTVLCQSIQFKWAPREANQANRVLAP